MYNTYTFDLHTHTHTHTESGICTTFFGPQKHLCNESDSTVCDILSTAFLSHNLQRLEDRDYSLVYASLLCLMGKQKEKHVFKCTDKLNSTNLHSLGLIILLISIAFQRYFKEFTEISLLWLYFKFLLFFIWNKYSSCVHINSWPTFLTSKIITGWGHYR